MYSDTGSWSNNWKIICGFFAHIWLNCLSVTSVIAWWYTLLPYLQKSQVILFSPQSFASQVWEDKKHHEMTFPEPDSPLLPRCCRSNILCWFCWAGGRRNKTYCLQRKNLAGRSLLVKAILQLLKELPLCPKWTQIMTYKLMLERKWDLHNEICFAVHETEEGLGQEIEKQHH